MISMLASVFPTISVTVSHCVSSHTRKRSWLGALCAILAVLLCGAGSIASAQTAHFSGAQTSVGSGFISPLGLALDGSGNLYVTDTSSIVKEVLAVNGSIPSSPTILTLANDGGQSYPFGVAVDRSGNVYFADSGNNAVKEILAVNGSIPASPTILTLSISFNHPAGIALDASGNLYVTDYSSNPVHEILAVNGSIPASPTILTLGSGFSSYPFGIAVDNSGNVYVGDTGNNAVKEILAVNGSIPASPTIITLGSGFVGPRGVALDGSGNVYVADTGNRAVKKILAVNGSIPASPTIIILGSNFMGAPYSAPSSVVVGVHGDVYVAVDSVGTMDQVLDLSPSSGNFGSVNVGATSPSIPMTFTFDTAGTLGSTAVLTQGAAVLDFADAGTGTCKANSAYTAGQTCTVNVTFTPRFAGSRYGAAVLYSGIGTVLATGYVQGTGAGPQVNFLPGAQSVIPSTGLNGQYGVAVDGGGNVYILDSSHVVKETLAAGNYTQSTVATGIVVGFGVAVDGVGNVYIADTGNNRVLKETLSANGYTQSILASGVGYPMGVAVDGSGNVYIADTEGGQVLKETLAAGSYIQSTVASGLNYPAGVAVDGSGNVYIADTENFRVLKETLSAGSYTQSTLPNAGQVDPQGIAVDGSGNVYFTSGSNSDVAKETLVAGSYVESTVLSNLDKIGSPFGVAVTGSGNLYIGDPYNNQVLKVDFSDPPSLSFASTALGATSSDSPQTVTVENVGNAALTFPIPSSGNNPSIATNFTLNDNGTSACAVLSASSSEPGTLAAGASCLLPISFAPTVTGTLSGSLVLTDNNLNAAAPGYTLQTITLNGIGLQATPTITWATPAAITYGTALSATQLNASSTVAGSFAYSPAAGTVLTAGAQTLTVTFTPTDTTDYTTATSTVTLTVNQATPTITWATPAAITYGTALSATQLDASSTVAGSIAYSPAAGTVLTAGAQTLTVTLTPTDTTDYTTAAATVTLTVNKATPPITWATPAAITYGTALSATQLNANSTVAGSFTYSPVAGTVLNAGAQPLTVTFTPTDTTDYTTATSTVTLTVNKATPPISWATPAAITYGTALSATQLNASSTVAGSFAYSPAAGTVLTAGAQTLTVTFTPTDTTDYTTATSTVTLTVNQATPTITWATPAAITYGTALSATQLNTSSTVAGSFAYSPAAGTVLTSGSQPLTATFTPTDTTDYTTAAATVTLTVNKATPPITWATPAAITYGTALSATQLNASSTVAGSFAYSPVAGTVLAAGAQPLTVTFTPTDTTDYTTAPATVTLTVNKATPPITWATPAAITYGTALSATQLDTSSTVAGSFTYSPVAGTLLTAGSHTLSVTFAPTNTTDYTTATATVTLTVNKATPTITWATPTAITYGTALSGTQLDAKASVPGTFLYSPVAGTVPAVGTDTLNVTFTPTDTTDYTTATGSVQLKVNPAPSFTLGASPTSLTVAQGAYGKSTITVTDQNGFTGSVTLAASGLPSGVTAAFATNPTTGTSVLTLTASSTAAVGSATVTIKGTSGSLTASTTIALTISCTPTTIVPYISINGGSTWTEESSATVSSTSAAVDLGPQPASGGSWSWTGPNKYTSTSRQINSIPLTVGADSYLATYTNASGCKSTETFTITVK